MWGEEMWDMGMRDVEKRTLFFCIDYTLFGAVPHNNMMVHTYKVLSPDLGWKSIDD